MLGSKLSTCNTSLLSALLSSSVCYRCFLCSLVVDVVKLGFTYMVTSQGYRLLMQAKAKLVRLTFSIFCKMLQKLV